MWEKIVLVVLLLLLVVVLFKFIFIIKEYNEILKLIIYIYNIPIYKIWINLLYNIIINIIQYNKTLM